MSRKKAKKRGDVVAHFQRRCMERLGYVIPQDELKADMEAHRLRVHSKQSNTKTHFLYTTKDGREVVVVYDKMRHAFVTVLFPELMCDGEDEE